MVSWINDFVSRVPHDVSRHHLAFTLNSQCQYFLRCLRERAYPDTADVYEKLADAFPHVWQGAVFVNDASNARRCDGDSG